MYKEKEEIVKKIAGKKHVAAVYEVRGERIEVWCDVDHAWMPFSAVYEGKTVNAKDIDALLDDLKRITRRKRVSIHIEFTDQDGKRDGIVTGKHTGNNNLLVTWDNGVSEQVDAGYNRRSYYKRLTPAQKTELKQLRAASNEAHRQLENFRNDLTFDIGQAVEDAIGEVVELAIAEEETPNQEEEANDDSHVTAAGDS